MSGPYVPRHFEERQLGVLHDAIRANPFGTIVTQGPDGLIASHVPFVLDEDDGESGTLLFHLAKANPQWRAVRPETEALAIFLGPHAYVSPTSYPTQRETGKVVPTWNYIAVHAYGPLEVYDDPDGLQAFVTRLTAIHERASAEPWSPSDAPADFIETQLKGIVGLRMPIRRILGKWKVGQNRPEADRRGAIAALENSEFPSDRATAKAMRAALDRDHR